MIFVIYQKKIRVNISNKTKVAVTGVPCETLWDTLYIVYKWQNSLINFKLRLNTHKQDSPDHNGAWNFENGVFLDQ